MTSRETNTKKQSHSRSGSMSVISNLLNQGVVQPNQSKNDSTATYTPVFFQEISDIMRGYGDCERPLRESVILVEKIVIEQMRAILNDVINLAIERKGVPQPSQRDFEFLMRKSPVKIFRLQKHLKDLEFRRRYQDMLSGRATSCNDELDGDKSDEEHDDVAEKFDEEKARRLFRADRISLTLNGTQYAQYNEARRTSFHCRNSTAIKTKLRQLVSPPPEAHLSNHVFTILGFLVHETIATIVDYCILTRLDSSNRDTEPFHRVTSSGECKLQSKAPALISFVLFLARRHVVQNAPRLPRSDAGPRLGRRPLNHHARDPRGAAETQHELQSPDGDASQCHQPAVPSAVPGHLTQPLPEQSLTHKLSNRTSSHNLNSR